MLWPFVTTGQRELLKCLNAFIPSCISCYFEKKKINIYVQPSTVNREIFAALKVGEFAFFQLAVDKIPGEFAFFQLAVDKIPRLLHKFNG
jgi:hypothetical protein